MRHIKTINELYKKTYQSAAKKLYTRGHRSRAEEVELHGLRHGINEPFGEKEDARVYKFNNIKEFQTGDFYSLCVSKVGSDKSRRLGPFNPPPPFFHIVGYTYDRYYPSRYGSNEQHDFTFRIYVYFKNNFGEILTVEVDLKLEVPKKGNWRENPAAEYINPTVRLDAYASDTRRSDGTNDINDKHSKRFKFDNRKDAMKFKNFLVDISSEISKLPIGPDYYRSRGEFEETYSNIYYGDKKPVVKYDENKDDYLVPFELIKDVPISYFYETP